MGAPDLVVDRQGTWMTGKKAAMRGKLRASLAVVLSPLEHMIEFYFTLCRADCLTAFAGDALVPDPDGAAELERTTGETGFTAPCN